jgi:hypothetical protein
VRQALIAFRAALVFITMVLASHTALAQPVTPEAIEQHEREITRAWDAHDSVKILDLDAVGGVGFGFRTKAPRTYTTREETLAILKGFFDQFAYYRVTLDEIHSTVTGDVGLAWGFYTEEFQVKGRPQERIRGRFSDVWKRDASGWHLLIYHRDAQSFDGSGRYVPVPVP